MKEFSTKLKKKKLKVLEAEWDFLNEIVNRKNRISFYEEEKLAKLAKKIAKLEFDLNEKGE